MSIPILQILGVLILVTVLYWAINKLKIPETVRDVAVVVLVVLAVVWLVSLFGVFGSAPITLR